MSIYLSYGIFSTRSVIFFISTKTLHTTHNAFLEPLFLFLLLYQLTITSQHQRHHRFCLRLLLKHPDSHALWVLCGHNAMVSGSFKHALGIKEVLFEVLILHTWLIKWNIFMSSSYSGPLHCCFSENTASASTVWYILKPFFFYLQVSMSRPSRPTLTTPCTACVLVSPSSTWRLRSMSPNDTHWYCR